MTGRYSCVNDTTLSIEYQPGSKLVREELKVQVKNDTMTVTKSNGIISLWKRME